MDDFLGVDTRIIKFFTSDEKSGNVFGSGILIIGEDLFQRGVTLDHVSRQNN